MVVRRAESYVGLAAQTEINRTSAPPQIDKFVMLSRFSDSISARKPPQTTKRERSNAGTFVARLETKRAWWRTLRSRNKYQIKWKDLPLTNKKNHHHGQADKTAAWVHICPPTHSVRSQGASPDRKTAGLRSMRRRFSGERNVFFIFRSEASFSFRPFFRVYGFTSHGI